jgi:hypothetical protein
MRKEIDMHYLIYTTVRADTREEAFERVRNWMEWEYIMEHFEPKSTYDKPWDYWSIGGRFSGHILKAYPEASDQYYEYETSIKNKYNMTGTWIQAPKEVMEQQQNMYDKIDAWWVDNMPEPFNECQAPLTRNRYSSNHYEDDIKIIDHDIYDAFLSDFSKKVEYKTTEFEQGGEHRDICFMDLDEDFPSEEFIGNKFLAIVEAHI